MTILISEIGSNNKANDIDNMNDVYGVEIDFNTGTFTRLAGAAGKSGGTDFDTVDIFNRRRCNVTDDGVVTAYYGDTHYVDGGMVATTIMKKDGTIISEGTRVQTMVEQKKFYYKVVPIELSPTDVDGEYHIRKIRYYISSVQKEGFKIHPAFVTENGINDVIYIGAYEAGVYSEQEKVYVSGSDPEIQVSDQDKLASIGYVVNDDCYPYSANERTVLRTMANNIGSGWGLKTFTVVSMDQLLFLIEYAQLDSQKTIGIGNTKNPGEVAPVGITRHLGNKTGFDISINPSGLHDQVITYRGEENIYGNMAEWIDGVNIVNRELTWSNNTRDFVDDDTLNNIYTSSMPPLTNNIVASFVYNTKSTDDWAFVPSEVRNTGGIIGDVFNNYYSTVWGPVIYGGSCIDETSAGLFYMRGNIGSATTRLLFMPNLHQ